MDAETNQSDPQTGITPHAVPQAEGVSQVPPAGPWEEYLIGKKVSADRFLSKLMRGPIPIPDEKARSSFADAVAASPDRVGRLVALLRASMMGSDAVRRVVSE